MYCDWSLENWHLTSSGPLFNFKRLINKEIREFVHTDSGTPSTNAGNPCSSNKISCRQTSEMVKKKKISPGLCLSEYSQLTICLQGTIKTVFFDRSRAIKLARWFCGFYPCDIVTAKWQVISCQSNTPSPQCPTQRLIRIDQVFFIRVKPS